MTIALLVLAGAVAVVDWLAVARRSELLERFAKPLTLLLLIAAALSAPVDQNWLVVAALVLGLLGDIGLLVSADGDEPDLPFLLGLGAFMLGHVAYLAAFVRLGVDAGDAVIGLVLVGVLASVSLGPVLRGAADQAGTAFAGIVGTYASVLAAMAVFAVGTGRWEVGAGGMLFLVSDSLLARGRFARPVPHGDLLVIVTYHAAQALILIGMIRSF